MLIKICITKSGIIRSHAVYNYLFFTGHHFGCSPPSLKKLFIFEKFVIRKYIYLVYFNLVDFVGEIEVIVLKH